MSISMAGFIDLFYTFFFSSSFRLKKKIACSPFKFWIAKPIFKTSPVIVQAQQLLKFRGKKITMTQKNDLKKDSKCTNNKTSENRLKGAAKHQN